MLFKLEDGAVVVDAAAVGIRTAIGTTYEVGDKIVTVSSCGGSTRTTPPEDVVELVIFN